MQVGDLSSNPGSLMRPIVNPRFYPFTRAVAWVVLVAMLLSVIYAAWMSLANWAWIGV